MRALHWMVVISIGAPSCHAALAAGPVDAAPPSCKPVPRIQFHSGESSARFDGFLERARQSCFAFSARKGQRVAIDIADADDATTFSLYRPGYRIEYGNPANDDQVAAGWTPVRIPINTYKGITLTTPVEDQDKPIHTYRGVLPQTGEYLIVVELGGAGAAGFGGRISIH